MQDMQDIRDRLLILEQSHKHQVELVIEQRKTDRLQIDRMDKQLETLTNAVTVLADSHKTNESVLASAVLTIAQNTKAIKYLTIIVGLVSSVIVGIDSEVVKSIVTAL